MPGAVPDVKHLLELMTRAADELKATQKEAADTRAESDGLSKRLARATEELKVAQRDAADARADGETLAKRLSWAESELAQEKARTVALQDELDEVKNATYVPLVPVTDSQTDSGLTALPDEQTRVGIGDPGLLQGRIRSLEAQLSTGLVEQQALEARLKAAEEAAAVADTANGRVKELEDALAAANERLQESTNAEALETANARIAQLEVDHAALRTRRDELNVELGKVEKERNTARAKVAELEGATQSVRSELEVQLKGEQEKHQATSQKLLEARGRVRELEGELATVKGALSRAETQVKTAADDKERALRDLKAAHESVREELAKRVGQLEGLLEHATSEWRHVEHQYEQLHKEMLLVLDQRDEARRELATLRDRLGRFSL